MDASEIGIKILEAIAPLLLAGLAYVAAMAARLINAKIKNEYLRGVLVRTDDAVVAAVTEAMQTAVAEAKKANADGQLTAEEKAQIKAAVMLNVKSHLGTKGLGELMKILGLDDGSVAKLLSSKIESAVYSIKSAGVAASPLPQ